MSKNRNNVFDAIVIMLISTAAALLLFSIPRPAPVCGYSHAWQLQGGEPVVRLHVCAAGDSEDEQRFKMDLVKHIRQLLAARCLPREEEGYEAYLSLLGDYLPQLQKSLQKCAFDAGVGAIISVHLGSENFPMRAYGRRIYPAGEYTALTITIGEGEGENWWCLLFPALCFPPADADNSRAEQNDEEGISHTAAERGTDLTAWSRAEEAGESGCSGCWRIKIWDLIKRPGQQIIEKAGRIFYN